MGGECRLVNSFVDLICLVSFGKRKLLGIYKMIKLFVK